MLHFAYTRTRCRVVQLLQCHKLAVWRNISIGFSSVARCSCLVHVTQCNETVCWALLISLLVRSLHLDAKQVRSKTWCSTRQVKTLSSFFSDSCSIHHQICITQCCFDLRETKSVLSIPVLLCKVRHLCEETCMSTHLWTLSRHYFVHDRKHSHTDLDAAWEMQQEPIWYHQHR